VSFGAVARDTRDAQDRVRRVAIDHHDDAASVFDDHYDVMSQSRFGNAFAYGRHKVDVLLEMLLEDLPPGAEVLDIGCGTGVYLRRFAEMGFGSVGVEPAPAMLERARRTAPDSEIHTGVATALPVASTSYDLVTAVEVYRYLHRDDTRRAYSEVLRVLRPGGTFFFTMVNRFALDGFYALQRARQLVKGTAFDRVNPHCEFFTPGEIDHDLRAAGFAHARFYGRLFGPMRLLYKLAPQLAPRLAPRLESLDDAICNAAWTIPFAGHLVCTARKP